MSYPQDEIKEVIERVENERAIDELSSLEHEEGFVKKELALTGRSRAYLEFLGDLIVGISVGVFSMIFNFLLFVWLLHIEF